MPMSYEKFKEKVLAEFMDNMPGKYQNMELVSQEVRKVNQTLDGISLLNPESETNISPTIYVNYMYEDYLENGSFDAALSNGVESMVYGFENAPKVPEPVDIENSKDKIVFQLINSESNQDLLANVPSRAFEDLSIIYRLVVEKEGFSVGSAIVTNDLMESMHLSENELYNLAKVNTPILFEPTVKGMHEIMQEKMGMDMGLLEADEVMWVISNEEAVNGAATILYDDILKNLSEKVKGDLYLLPSSVHEWISVRAEDHELKELEQMVQEVNSNVLSPGELLSNKVYYYNQKEQTLSVATAEYEKESLSDLEVARCLEEKIMSAVNEIDDVSGDKVNDKELTGGLQEESYGL